MRTADLLKTGGKIMDFAAPTHVKASLVAKVAAGDFERRGPFWSAVRTAHRLGHKGQGRRIIVLDVGFDLSQPLLAHALPLKGTRSRSDPSARHGTVVAMLVAHVAPEAELILMDTSSRSGKNKPIGSNISRGIRYAALEQVDVVCISSATDDPHHALSPEELSIRELFESGGDPTYLAEVARRWISEGGVKGHARGGCDSTGEVCAAITELSADAPPLVVAAAGNDPAVLPCPARHTRTLAAGFHVRKSRVVDNAVRESTGPPLEFDQSLVADLTLEEIPSLDGTSYAAPLIAGFAALVEPKEMVSGSLIRQSIVLGMIRDDTIIPKNTVLSKEAEDFRSVNALYELSGQIIEQVHHSHDTSESGCLLCIYLFSDLWRMRGLLWLRAQQFRFARTVLEQGATVAPLSPDILANLAAVHYFSALASVSLAAQCAGLLTAASYWEKADGLVDQRDPGYAKWAQEARRRASVIGSQQVRRS